MSMTAEKLANSLKISIEEAKQVLEMDKRIDRGEKLFELTPQQKKVEKEMRQAARAPTTYKFENRARKADEMKKCILSQLVKALEPNCDAPPEIVNSEREFTFFYSGKKYKVVLSCPRT